MLPVKNNFETPRLHFTGYDSKKCLYVFKHVGEIYFFLLFSSLSANPSCLMNEPKSFSQEEMFHFEKEWNIITCAMMIKTLDKRPDVWRNCKFSIHGKLSKNFAFQS